MWEDLTLIYCSYLAVRYRNLTQPCSIALKFLLWCLQISGYQKQTVDIRRIFCKWSVHHVLIDPGNHALALKKGIQFLRDIARCSLQYIFQYFVLSGVHPVCLRQASSRQIIDHWPRVIYFPVPEEISIIPVPKFLILIRCSVINKHFTHFGFREAKETVVLLVHYRINRKIVQTTENALLRYPEYSGQESIWQITVILERPGKKVPHESDDLIIELFRIPFLDRSIILINNDDRGFFVMSCKHFGKLLKRSRKLYFIRMSV